MKPRFKKLQKICLVKDEDKQGIIIKEPKLISDSYYYEILFIRGEVKTYEEKYLRTIQEENTDIEESIRNLSLGAPEQLKTKITLLKLSTPFKNIYYSFKTGRIDFLPYQFKPLLKFLENPNQRLLIADEVGLGKTIEAGLILSELKSRFNIDRILVVCPGSSLIKKWIREMKSRFNEDFEELDSEKLEFYLNKCKENNAFRFQAICSLARIRKDKFQEMLVNIAPRIDLLIFDEAHRLRNRSTKSHEVGNILLENAESALFLTATPLNLGNEDLFNLLHLLSPQDFTNINYFEEIIQYTQIINDALRLFRGSQNFVNDCLVKLKELKEHKLYQDNPLYNEVINVLSTQNDIENNREKRIEIEGKIMNLNPLSSIFTRTRKREVQEKFPIRQPKKLLINEIHPLESEYIESFTKLVRSIYTVPYQNRSILPMAQQMPLRQMSSCLITTRNYLNNLASCSALEIYEDEEEVENFGQENNGNYKTIPLSQKERELIVECQSILTEIEQSVIDSKFDKFVELIEELLNSRKEPFRKILLFSFFKSTVEYLRKKLPKYLKSPIRIFSMTGDTKYIDRDLIVDEFRETNNDAILLSTEIGSEGLDFQFCEVLINYDLPWNPMVVEQRIGRLDRYGQENEKILIFNLYLPGTIEDRIFCKLYERIEIFKQSVGDLDSILGDEIDILKKEICSGKLTEEELEEKAKIIADTLARKKKLYNEFDKTAKALMTVDSYFEDKLSSIFHEKKYVTPEEMQELVRYFLKAKPGGKNRLKNEKDSKIFELTHSHNLTNFFREILLKDDVLNRQSVIEFLGRLDNDERPFKLTFDAETANKHKSLVYIGPRHPFILAIKSFFENNPRVHYPKAYGLKVNTREYSPGLYFFQIYQLEVTSFAKQIFLVAAVINMKRLTVEKKLSKNFFRVIQESSPLEKNVIRINELDNLSEARKKSDEFLHNVKLEKEQEVCDFNRAIIQARILSLKKSEEIRTRNIEEMLAKPDLDYRIRRMRKSQMENIRLKVQQKISELRKKENTIISFEPCFGGLLLIK